MRYKNKDNNNQESEPKLVCVWEKKIIYSKINELLILFFFECDNSLRQGYLHINPLNSYKVKDPILEELKWNPMYFVKDRLSNFNKDGEIFIRDTGNNFELYIFPKNNELNLVNLKKELEKIREENNYLRFRSRTMVGNNYSNKHFWDKFKKITEEYKSKCHDILKSTLRATLLKNSGKNMTSFKDDTIKANKVIVGKDNLICENENINLDDIQVNEGEEQDNENYEIFDESKLGLVGLNNIGATCYMNATLQCFSNISFLRHELLNKDLLNNLQSQKDTKKLSYALAEVLYNLWEIHGQKSYSPENFKNLIGSMNPLFSGIAANDPKDLILFILETMHNELKMIDDDISVDENFVPNQHDLSQVYKDFENCYLSKNKSFIFDIFFGCQNIITSCLNCNTSLYNVQVNNIIFFPLEEIRKYKNKNYDTPVIIQDCFEYTQKYETYNSYYCNVCYNNNSQAISFTKYLYAPRVLIINLNRGKGVQFNVKFDFDDSYLNIKKYVTLEESPFKYELIGVICHFGESGMGGHFIAFCKRKLNDKIKKWYKFNDGIVYEVEFNEVRTNGMPYVLFYSCINE